MTEHQPEINPVVDVLAQLRTQLGVENELAQADLHTALVKANVNPDIAGAYKKLEPKPGILQQVWSSLLGKTILITLAASTAARLASEHPASVSDAVRIVLDNAVAWAGTGIDKLELTSIILGVSAAAVWTLLPPVVYERVVKQEAKRVALAEEYREGNANLAGKVGLNIHIDVGKSDPSALLLTRLFHLSGREVVTFWDERNSQFLENRYWQRTRNDWTSRETLTRGDIQETVYSVSLVSNRDDIFLSTRHQDPSRQAQDMTDTEAIGSVNARNAVRKQMGLPPIHHTLVTNPRRVIEIDVARSGDKPYPSKTVGGIVQENYPRVHLIDPDRLVISKLANMAATGNLPLELVTNKERRKEYQALLEAVVEEYNQEVEQGLANNKTRIATPEDGENTLTIFYGTNDDDTVAQTESYRNEFSRAGESVAIINNPEVVNRLQPGTKYICVGTVVAEAVYQDFSDLVKQGEITLT